MTYIVKADLTLSLDSYTEGIDLTPIKTYTIEEKINADDPAEAVTEMYDQHLHQPINFNNTDGHKLYTSHLVTEQEQTPTEQQLKEWKEDEQPLYTLDINIAVYTYTKESLA